MKNHERWENLIPDYLGGLLQGEDAARFEAHLKECSRCRKVVENARKLRGNLAVPEGARLSPEGRLRLYERLNAERARRGEKLLRIPDELLARVRAKTRAAGDAAGDVARTGARSARRMGGKGMAVAGAAGRGMKAVGGRAARTAGKGARRARKMGIEAARTVADVGRIATEEVAEVIGDAMQSPFKALLAPPRMAGKAAKMAARTAKGGCKISLAGARGMAEAGFGTMGMMGEMVKHQGKIARAMLEGAVETARSSDAVARTALKGTQKVAQAQPEESGEK